MCRVPSPRLARGYSICERSLAAMALQMQPAQNFPNQSAVVCSRTRQATSPRPAAGKVSDFDLAAELDDPVGRDAEELGGVERQVGQEDEQPVAPAEDGGT